MGGLRPPRKNTCLHRVRGMGNPGFPIPLHEGFKGGQNIRANVAYTALERPRAWLWSPLSSFAGEGEGVRTTQRIPTPSRPSALIRSVRP